MIRDKKSKKLTKDSTRIYLYIIDQMNNLWPFEVIVGMNIILFMDKNGILADMAFASLPGGWSEYNLVLIDCNILN